MIFSILCHGAMFGTSMPTRKHEKRRKRPWRQSTKKGFQCNILTCFKKKTAILNDECDGNEGWLRVLTWWVIFWLVFPERNSRMAKFQNSCVGFLKKTCCIFNGLICPHVFVCFCWHCQCLWVPWWCWHQAFSLSSFVLQPIDKIFGTRSLMNPFSKMIVVKCLMLWMRHS